jgi:hypothetical protein
MVRHEVVRVAQTSRARRVTGAFADATGRTDEELRRALTVAVAEEGLIGALRLLNRLGDLGFILFGHTRRRA